MGEAPRPAGSPFEAFAPGTPPPASLVRASAAFHYVESLGKIGGWLNETTALAIIEILWLQERLGIAGDLAEIGVFQGKSFLALAAGAKPGERLFAVDIFDTPDTAATRPEYDVVAYGRGNEAIFRANLDQYFPGTDVRVIARSSTDLRGHESEFGLEKLRFLSIDGGHTRHLTLNDLAIADACLTDGGLCCLDDVFNVHWLGVISGLFEFLQSGPGLIPVALFPNKLFLSRPAYQKIYANAFRQLFAGALERERLELHQAEIDVFGDNWPDVGAALRAIAGQVAASDIAAALACVAREQAKAAEAEAARLTATARAERAERKLAKRRRRSRWFAFGGIRDRAPTSSRQLNTAGCPGPDATETQAFDEHWYLGHYADVAAALTRGDVASGLAHYRAFGQREGRCRSAADHLAATTGTEADIAGAGRAPTEEDRRQKVSAVWSVDAEQRAQVCGWYWLAHPLVVARVNTMISGDPGCDAYGRLRQLVGERGWRLPIERAVSLGCGSGNLERDLVQRGMVGSIDGYDLAEGAIERARRLAGAAGFDTIRYHVADLESLAWPERSLDAVFAHQSVHHVENLEALYGSVRMALKPHGVFHLHEFVGPSRFQWADTQLAAVNAFLDALPAHLRRLPDGRPKPTMRRPTEEAMIAADPSEAIRSAAILQALESDFEVIERRDIGGTLLHLALGDIAQNFDAGREQDRHCLEQLFDIEDRMLSDRSIRSDFVVVTAVARQK